MTQTIDWDAPVQAILTKAEADELHRVCVFSTNVHRELTEMKKLGMRVPKKALVAALSINGMREYVDMHAYPVNAQRS